MQTLTAGRHTYLSPRKKSNYFFKPSKRMALSSANTNVGQHTHACIYGTIYVHIETAIKVTIKCLNSETSIDHT